MKDFVRVCRATGWTSIDDVVQGLLDDGEVQQV